MGRREFHPRPHRFADLDRGQPDRPPLPRRWPNAWWLWRSLSRLARRFTGLDRPGDGGLRDVAALGAADLHSPRPPPHRARRFKLSQDPTLAAKLRDLVGLYLDR
jgi:hypothetical protein